MKKIEFENIENIDFWNNEYDLSVGIFVNSDDVDWASLSLSKKDKEAPVKREEIINALALAVIGFGNQEANRYEPVLQDVLDRCREIEKQQSEKIGKE